VLAVNPEIRDHCLSLSPEILTTPRTRTFSGSGLLGWLSFPQVFVGTAIYKESRFEDFGTALQQLEKLEEIRQGRDRAERERSWWHCVWELQRFVSGTAEAES
jgi:hypothetical protein